MTEDTHGDETDYIGSFQSIIKILVPEGFTRQTFYENLTAETFHLPQSVLFLFYQVINAVETIGLFRVGNATQNHLDSLIKENYNDLKNDLADTKAAALLKVIIRNYPGGIIPKQQFKKLFVMETLEVPKIKEIMSQLKRENTAFLKRIFQLLRFVASKNEKNQMDTENLAKCLGLTFDPEILKPEETMTRTKKVKVINEFLIEHCEEIWDESLN